MLISNVINMGSQIHFNRVVRNNHSNKANATGSILILIEEKYNLRFTRLIGQNTNYEVAVCCRF